MELLASDGEAIDRIAIARGRGGPELLQIVAAARRKGIAIEFRPREEIDRLAGRKSQGVVGFCREFKYADVQEVLANRRHPFKNSLVLILDSITDPQNLGSLIRSAFFFGANGVIIPEDRAAPVTAAVMKASSGAANRIAIAKTVNIARTLDALKDAGYWIYGTDSHAEALLEGIDFSGDAALVMGSEGAGLRPLVKKKCDLLVSVAGTGDMDSLNVSVAAGIVLYRMNLTRAKA